MFSVYDIETLKGLFLYVSKNLETGQVFIFRIDRYRNDLVQLVKHLRGDNQTQYLVSYNGLSFDAQVVQFILDNYEKWSLKTNAWIAATIYQFAQDVIDDTRYGKFPPYKETQLWCKQVDLFRILGYDNENRRCSLKWLEYTMDMANIEEMPIDHQRKDLSAEEIEQIIRYCLKDIGATEQLFKIVRGDTVLPVYAGKDMIQSRLDLMAEFQLPPQAMSWSDTRIGDELNKRGYAKECGIELNRIYYLKQQRQTNAGFTFGDCIPRYVNFKTPKLQAFLEAIRGIRVNLNKDDQEFPIEIGGTTYKIKKGGIHSSEGKRMVIAGNGELLIDADVGSQYPNAIVKRGLYPAHLGPKWLINYKKTIKLRLFYKDKSQRPQLSVAERIKYKGLAEMLKRALNAGGFGKTNERNNWQYDPLVQFSCTIGNQFEMLMLIEELELNGIHVISANTDGIVTLLPREMEECYYQICHSWEERVGNSDSGRLEYTYFSKIIQTSVNDYLAIKVNGEVKRKGDFATTYELHQNKSRRIIPLALEKYFLEGMPVEQTIKGHREVLDFCVGVKASSDYHYEAISNSGEREIYHRIVRYYVSDNGRKLLKIKNTGSEKTGPPVSQCEKGHWLSTVYNEALNPDTDFHINYDYYIGKARQIILGLEHPHARKGKAPPPNTQQLAMF